jgi:hypothetical protein
MKTHLPLTAKQLKFILSGLVMILLIPSNFFGSFKTEDILKASAITLGLLILYLESDEHFKTTQRRSIFRYVLLIGFVVTSFSCYCSIKNKLHPPKSTLEMGFTLSDNKAVWLTNSSLDSKGGDQPGEALTTFSPNPDDAILYVPIEDDRSNTLLSPIIYNNSSVDADDVDIIMTFPPNYYIEQDQGWTVGTAINGAKELHWTIPLIIHHKKRTLPGIKIGDFPNVATWTNGGVLTYITVNCKENNELPPLQFRILPVRLIKSSLRQVSGDYSQSAFNTNFAVASDIIHRLALFLPNQITLSSNKRAHVTFLKSQLDATN